MSPKVKSDPVQQLEPGPNDFKVVDPSQVNLEDAFALPPPQFNETLPEGPSPDEGKIAGAHADPPIVDKSKIVQVFRRRAVVVQADQRADGSWTVHEGTRKLMVPAQEFAQFYEIDSGGEALPNLAPGSYLDWRGKRICRVIVLAGTGNIGYWAANAPSAEAANYKCVADNIDNPAARHRAGKFVDAFEAKPGALAWIVLEK